MEKRTGKTAEKKKFISIIRGYHKQIFDFDKKQHYHMMPFAIMKEHGYELELFAVDSRVKIEDDPLFIDGVKVIYYSGFWNYVKYLWANRSAIVYSNSLNLKTLFAGVICRRSMFYSHTNPIGKSKMRFIKSRIIRFFYMFYMRVRVNNIQEEALIGKYIGKKKVLRLPLSISDHFLVNDNLHERKKKLVWLGNIYPIKQPEVLIGAMRIVHEKYPSYTLHIIGEDRYKEHTGRTYQQVVDEAGLSKVILLDGYIPHKDLKKVLAETMIFIITSSDEGMCLAAYESGIAGNALCLPDIMAFPTAFKKNARYHKNAEDLASNIIYYIEHEDERIESIKNNQKMILLDYSYDIIKKKLEDELLAL